MRQIADTLSEQRFDVFLSGAFALRAVGMYSAYLLPGLATYRRNSNPHRHLDIGFTNYQPKIEELQNRNLDRLLDEMRRDREMLS